MKIAISTEMDYLGNPQMCRSILNQDYMDFVKIAGYSPYIVCVGMDVHTIAADMDGLLLSGGKDVSPLMYGEDLGWNGAQKCNLVRDTFEHNLYNAFLAVGKPVFGICRGFQLVALFSNDRLSKVFEQDINKLKSVTQLHQQGSADITGDNPVHTIECRGVMEKLVGKKLDVNSFHHQGFVMGSTTADHGWIRQCEDIFCWARSRESARVLEAFGMMVDGIRVAGVQYHPERMMRRATDRSKHLALFQYTMGTLECDWEPSPPPTAHILNVTHPFLKRRNRHGKLNSR